MTAISCNFGAVKILYCPRACNQVAQAIAAKGALMADEPNFLSNGPVPFVTELVASNIASHTV